VGDKDEEGYMTKDGMFKKNSKENGQYHSNWLSMMMPRLYLAKNLLTQDGVIFVSIDDNEVHNLRLLMNEIFGEENFVAQFIWIKKNVVQNDAKNVSVNHEYIIAFFKNIGETFFNLTERNEEQLNRYSNPDNDPKGDWTSVALQAKSGSKTYEITFPNGVFWKPVDGTYPRLSKETLLKFYEDNRLWFGKDGNNVPRLKKYLSEVKDGVITNSVMPNEEVGSTQLAKETLKKLISDNVFDTPKPTGLIKKLVKLNTEKIEGDIILDFFAGSGTIGQAIMELNKEDGGNRKYICVQLPELCDEKSEAFKAGYKTIAEISKERIRRAGKKVSDELVVMNDELQKKITKLQAELPTDDTKQEIKNLKLKIENTKLDNGFKVLKLADSNFKQWQQIEGKDAKALTEQMQLFIDPVSENATIENMVYEFLLKSGKDLNSKIEKRNDYFVINNSEMIMLLESVSQTIIEKVIGEKPMKVIALDKLFKDNDQLKTNTVLQMRDAGIEFKTI
jgi:adenine-specific DNA-methyltransferase